MREFSELLLFSLTYTGSVDLKQDIDAAILTSHLAEMLLAARASSVKIESNRVTFNGVRSGLVGNWNLLVPFGFGELTVDTAARLVRYRLSLRRLFLAGAIAIAAIELFMLWGKAPSRMLITAPAEAFIWLVGGNLIVGLARFHHFVRRAVKTSVAKE